jgi:hypothetical protein
MKVDLRMRTLKKNTPTFSAARNARFAEIVSACIAAL